jgi:hypothetical protein
LASNAALLSAELDCDTLQALAIPAGEHDVGPFDARAPGRLDSDPRAAADHDDGLPEQS